MAPSSPCVWSGLASIVRSGESRTVRRATPGRIRPIDRPVDSALHRGRGLRRHDGGRHGACSDARRPAGDGPPRTLRIGTRAQAPDPRFVIRARQDPAFRSRARSIDPGARVDAGRAPQTRSVNSAPSSMTGRSCLRWTVSITVDPPADPRLAVLAGGFGVAVDVGVGAGGVLRARPPAQHGVHPFRMVALGRASCASAPAAEAPLRPTTTPSTANSIWTAGRSL